MSDDQTRGERLQIMLSPDELTVVDDFRFKERMPSRAAAVRELLKRGLAAVGYALAAPGTKSSDHGVIGNEEFTQRPQLANYDAVTINRATYAVSLEPEGGSPTGAPTGPVLYSGKLLQVTPPTFAAPSP